MAISIERILQSRNLQKKNRNRKTFTWQFEGKWIKNSIRSSGLCSACVRRHLIEIKFIVRVAKCNAMSRWNSLSNDDDKEEEENHAENGTDQNGWNNFWRRWHARACSFRVYSSVHFIRLISLTKIHIFATQPKINDRQETNDGDRLKTAQQKMRWQNIAEAIKKIKWNERKGRRRRNPSERNLPFGIAYKSKPRCLYPCHLPFAVYAIEARTHSHIHSHARSTSSSSHRRKSSCVRSSMWMCLLLCVFVSNDGFSAHNGKNMSWIVIAFFPFYRSLDFFRFFSAAAAAVAAHVNAFDAWTFSFACAVI